MYRRRIPKEPVPEPRMIEPRTMLSVGTMADAVSATADERLARAAIPASRWPVCDLPHSPVMRDKEPVGVMCLRDKPLIDDRFVLDGRLYAIVQGSAETADGHGDWTGKVWRLLDGSGARLASAARVAKRRWLFPALPLWEVSLPLWEVSVASAGLLHLSGGAILDAGMSSELGRVRSPTLMDWSYRIEATAMVDEPVRVFLLWLFRAVEDHSG